MDLSNDDIPLLLSPSPTASVTDNMDLSDNNIPLLSPSPEMSSPHPPLSSSNTRTLAGVDVKLQSLSPELLSPSPQTSPSAGNTNHRALADANAELRSPSPLEGDNLADVEMFDFKAQPQVFKNTFTRNRLRPAYEVFEDNMSSTSDDTIVPCELSLTGFSSSLSKPTPTRPLTLSSL
jgi:hypothetical protein